MDYEAAVNRILSHGIGRSDVPLDESILPDGFLSTLRPWSGLREQNFLDVMEAIVALPPFLPQGQAWEGRLVAGLWGLTTTARLWALDPDSMLQRNGLISPAESTRLLLWVRCIEMAVSRLLSGGDPEDALRYYRESREPRD